MKTAMKNKLNIFLLVGLVVIIGIGYVLTQGSAFDNTDDVLREAERKIISQSLDVNEAIELKNEFVIFSQEAQQEAFGEAYAMHDLSALLQAHLTAIDVIDNSKFEESTVIIRDALITRIIEIESVLANDIVLIVSAEEAINDLVDEIESTLSEFQGAQGVIPARMFDETQVAIQQASVALAEAQSFLLSDLEEDAADEALRARRFIVEARYTIELAELMQKEIKNIEL